MAKKKKIIKKTPTRVHSFRCTDKDWKELKKLAKECGISIGKYLVETGLKHRATCCGLLSSRYVPQSES